MKKYRRWQRILILSLLSFSVCAPIVFVSRRFKILTSFGQKEFVEDSPSVKHITDVLRLNSIEQEAAEGLKGPELDVFKDKDFSSVVRRSSNEYRDSDHFGNAQDDSELLEANETNEIGKDEHQIQQTIIKMNSSEKEQLNQEIVRDDQRLQSRPFRVVDEKVKQMRDQLITAKAYLSFARPGSTSRLMKALRARIRELERVVDEASRDSDLPRRGYQTKGYQSATVSVKLFVNEIKLLDIGHPTAPSVAKSAIFLPIVGNMATISATTFTSSIAPALKTSARITPPVAIGLPTVAKKGKVMCSTEKKGSVEANVSTIATSVSLLAAAAMSSPPAMALVDERLSTEGTGLPFGLSNNLLGWILFGVFGLIWALYFVYTSSLDEDEDSGLSL